MVGARAIVGVVRPREGQVPCDERVSFIRHVARDLHRVPVDVVDLASQSDGLELVVAGIERHRLQHVDSGAQELAVQLCERVRMLDHDFRA